jgi:hypothetical protein
MVRFSEEVFGRANRFVSENDNKANAPAWRYLAERLGELKGIKKLLLAIYYPNPVNRFRSPPSESLIDGG